MCASYFTVYQGIIPCNSTGGVLAKLIVYAEITIKLKDKTQLLKALYDML